MQKGGNEKVIQFSAENLKSFTIYRYKHFAWSYSNFCYDGQLNWIITNQICLKFRKLFDLTI